MTAKIRGAHCEGLCAAALFLLSAGCGDGPTLPVPTEPGYVVAVSIPGLTDTTLQGDSLYWRILHRPVPIGTPPAKDLILELLVLDLLQEMHTWTPLGCDDVRDLGITRLRSRIEHICYAKGTAKQGTLFFSVLYSSDWRAAGLDNSFGEMENEGYSHEYYGCCAG